jgi:NADH-quinone oxidoreductase subunit J
MLAATIFFYLFAALAIASAMMVILSRNPVHSVLFLILCFFNAAGLFILMGAEFLAMILVVVYVGAVAVLFLFVVMMLAGGRRDRSHCSGRTGAGFRHMGLGA